MLRAAVQIVTSVCYTYSCSDCYRSRSNDVSQCFKYVINLSLCLVNGEIEFL